jgi:hypothetical protein
MRIIGLTLLVSRPLSSLFDQGLQRLLIVQGPSLSRLIAFPVKQDSQRIDLCPEGLGRQQAQQDIPAPAVQQNVSGIRDNPRADHVGHPPFRLPGRHLLGKFVEPFPEVIRGGRQTCQGHPGLKAEGGGARASNSRRRARPTDGTKQGIKLRGRSLKR